MAFFDDRDKRAWLVLGVAAAIIYQLTGADPQQVDGFGPLARALLEGRLHLTIGDPGAVEQVPRPEGGWYLPYPPGPVVVMLPLVAIFANVDPGLVAAVLGGLNVALVHAVIRRLGASWSVATWLAVGFGFGSVAWWSAGTADVWNFAHTVSLTFALSALLLTVAGRYPLIAGLLFGVAAATRLPVGLTVPFYLALWARYQLPVLAETELGRRLSELPTAVGRSLRAIELRRVVLFVAGLAVPALLVAGYNFARFGTPFDFGYGDIPGIPDEPWYQDGVLSLSYVQRHIHAIFVRGFDYDDYRFPFFRPNWMGLSLVLSTPVFLWLVRARSRESLVAFAWLGIALALIPIVTHGTVGQVQFGYRFSQDVAPLLWLLLGWLFRDRMPVEAKAAIVLGVVVHTYGIWCIYFLDFVSY